MVSCDTHLICSTQELCHHSFETWIAHVLEKDPGTVIHTAPLLSNIQLKYGLFRYQIHVLPDGVEILVVAVQNRFWEDNVDLHYCVNLNLQSE